MTTDQKFQYKQRLLQYAQNILQERISVCKAAIENAQAAANEEEKSSVGDKYETSRAMSHLEKDMYSKQLSANKNELAALLSIDYSGLFSSAVPGAVIKCTGCSLFIAAGLGKILFEDQIVYMLSPAAPLSKSLYQKKKFDQAGFNNLVILDIY